MDFLDLLEEKLKLVEWDPEIMSRAVNSGFSGGEKKRNEILQMAVLEPTLAILDETDSGLDIDALRIVAAGVNQLRRPDNATIVVTHYQRLLNYIVPDFVHVLSDGRIVKSGGKELALELEARGYEWLEDAVGSRVMTEAFVQEFEARAGAGHRRAARSGSSRSAGPPWSASRGPASPAPRDEEWRFTPDRADRAGGPGGRPRRGAGELTPRAAGAVRLRARRLDARWSS